MKPELNIKATFKYDWIFLLGISLVTSAISPWWTSDGFNIPKLFFIVLLAFMILPNILSSGMFNQGLNYRKSLILTLLFPLNLFIILIFNDTNKIQQFYGEFGRRTGLITYVSCYVIFLYTFYKSSKFFINSIFKVFIGLGIFSATYGLIQPLGVVRINNLASKNMTPYSFFGNINFNSGFLGLVSILLISVLFFNAKRRSKVFYFSLLMLVYTYTAIYLTYSQQGFVVSFSGIVILTLIYVYKYNAKKNRFIFALLASIFLVAQFILGLFNRGLAANLIYEFSVQARNFYWKAGWEMAIHNPLMGIGLDRYGDWYWSYRDANTIEVLGKDDFTNSGHSIFIDILSSGGFPLLITYLLFVIIVFTSGLKTIREMPGIDFQFTSLFTCWIGFNVYSIFSIGQIGVLVWGWIFSGLIMGFNLNLSFNKYKKYSINQFNKNFLWGTIGVLIMIPITQESIDFKNALKINSSSGYVNYLDGNKIEPYGINIAATKINSFGLESKSLLYVNESLEKFPNNYDLWYLLFINKYATMDQKRLALENLQRLNVLNRISSK